jgi:hypothetical protein
VVDAIIEVIQNVNQHSYVFPRVHGGQLANAQIEVRGVKVYLVIRQQLLGHQVRSILKALIQKN